MNEILLYHNIIRITHVKNTRREKCIVINETFLQHEMLNGEITGDIRLV